MRVDQLFFFLSAVRRPSSAAPCLVKLKASRPTSLSMRLLSQTLTRVRVFWRQTRNSLSIIPLRPCIPKHHATGSATIPVEVLAVGRRHYDEPFELPPVRTRRVWAAQAENWDGCCRKRKIVPRVSCSKRQCSAERSAVSSVPTAIAFFRGTASYELTASIASTAA